MMFLAQEGFLRAIGTMSSSSPQSQNRLRRWPQEDWATARKRSRPAKGSSSTLEAVLAVSGVLLRAEMESLKDFTFLLAERVSALELRVQDQAREIAFLTKGHSQTRRTETG